MREISSDHFMPREADLFFQELESLTQKVYADRRPDDITHRRQLERWGILSSVLGYGTAWLGFNPISAILIALGISTRWMMAHFILHRGYDAYPNANRRERSSQFARGLWRWIDWCDWLDPPAWVHEHNVLHHYRLGENLDPDVPEVNLRWLKGDRIPRIAKLAVVLAGALTWKWTYYGPRLIQVATRKPGTLPPEYVPLAVELWNPMTTLGRRTLTRSWLSYAAIRFGLIPILFLPLGHAAWIAVLLNSLLAEVLTSIHTFVLIVPNHAGEELPRFENAPGSKNEFRLRQIVGSVNFHTGGDLNDFLHGWLNYQIEHHVWPDISFRQYQTWQPELRALCRRHGVPYIQESVGKRLWAMVKNVIGETSMPVIPSVIQSGATGYGIT